LRREARRRQRTRLKNADSGSGTADVTEMAQDEQLLATTEDEKPLPPTDLNEAEILQKVFIQGNCIVMTAIFSIIHHKSCITIFLMQMFILFKLSIV